MNRQESVERFFLYMPLLYFITIPGPFGAAKLARQAGEADLLPALLKKASYIVVSYVIFSKVKLFR